MNEMNEILNNDAQMTYMFAISVASLVEEGDEGGDDGGGGSGAGRVGGAFGWRGVGMISERRVKMTEIKTMELLFFSYHMIRPGRDVKTLSVLVH